MPYGEQSVNSEQPGGETPPLQILVFVRRGRPKAPSRREPFKYTLHTQGRPMVARPKTNPRSVCQDSFLQNRKKHPSYLVLTGQQIFANALTRGGKRATMCLPVGVRRFRPPAPGRRRAASMPDAWVDARRSAVSRAQCFCRLARGAPARHRGGTVPGGNSVPQGTHTKGKKVCRKSKKTNAFSPRFPA